MTVKTTIGVTLLAASLAACGTAQPDNTRPFINKPGSSAAGGGAPLMPVMAGTIPGMTKLDNATSALLPMGEAALPDNPGACNQDVDIVFVLDVSGSMVPPLTKLENEVSLVDAALQTKNLPGPPHYGLVLFVDDYQTMNGGAPYMSLDALQAELSNQISMTNGNSARQVDPNNPTPNFSWPEDSLDGLYAAATEFQWRPEDSTLRTIIHITDASFWDGMMVSSGSDAEAPGPGDTGSMHSYEETIQALRAHQIWVNTFAAKTGGPPDGMMSPPSHGQFRGTSVDVGIGFFEPYKGMPSIADSTGGFAWDIDEVYDGKISLATPINMSIEAHQCMQYPLN